MSDTPDTDELEEARGLILDLFTQACLREDGLYSHDFISAYEYAQEYLIRIGSITPERCNYT